MNSEQLKVIEDLEKQIPNLADSTTIKAGQTITDMAELENTPGWKRLVKELGGIRDGLIKTLLDAKTLREAQVLQVRIKDIDLLINTPRKYIEQFKTYLNRRQKWSKK